MADSSNSSEPSWGQRIKGWVDTLLVVDVFVVIAGAIWFGVAVLCHSRGVEAPLNLFQRLWEPLFTPAIGLLMGAAIAAAWWWVAKKENITPPPKATGAQRLQALKESTWALVLPVIVVVGLKMGVFTPTEAAAVAALHALLLAGVVYRALSWQRLWEVVLESTRASAVITIWHSAAVSTDAARNCM